LLGKFNTAADGDFQLCVTPQSLLRFSIVNAAKSRVDLDVSAPAFNDGGWHHFCGVYDGTNMHSYFDGALLGTAAQTGPIQSTVHAVGLGNNDTQNGYSWRGCLDEVKILTTAWTPASVSNEYMRVVSNMQSAGPLYPALTNSPSFISWLASLPPTPNAVSPPLFATSFSNNSVLIYPAWASDFAIEFSASLAPDSWSPLNATADFVGDFLVVGLPETFSNLFFRLSH
jgi:hypothetical protein